MPYQGSNAEWLNKMSMYELLMMIQDSKYRNSEMPCIIDLLGADTRGCSNETICKDCIADWLEEKHGGNE